MLKRYLQTFVALLSLLLAGLVTLAPILVVRAKLDGPTFMLAVCLWAALTLLALIPVSGMLLQKIWFFRGTGDPATLKQLQERLLAINAVNCPVSAALKRKKLIFTWRTQELQWCELFSRLDVKRLYELHCRFDADTRTVYLLDRIRLADFVVCPERVKIGSLRIPLPLLRARSRRLATINQFAALEPHDYDFHPREIKSPVLGTILACGWNVRFSLF